jgi:hypothetical protein
MTQPQIYMPMPQQVEHNGLGIASFVLGLVSFVLSLVPFGVLIAFPAALTGIGLGLGNLPRLNHHTANNKVLTWIGIGLNGLAIVIGVVFVAAVWHGIATS